MTVARSVDDVLAEHVVFEVDCIDRTRTTTRRPLCCGRVGAMGTRYTSQYSTGRHRWTSTPSSRRSSAPALAAIGLPASNYR